MKRQSIPESRAYIHHPCGGVTVLAENGFCKLADPFSQARQTLCVECEDYFTLDEFSWQDTGESIADFRDRLRSKVPALLGWCNTVSGFFTILFLGLLLGVAIGIALGLLLGALVGWIVGVIASLAGMIGAIQLWGLLGDKVLNGIFKVKDFRQLK